MPLGLLVAGLFVGLQALEKDARSRGLARIDATRYRLHSGSKWLSHAWTEQLERILVETRDLPADDPGVIADFAERVEALPCVAEVGVGVAEVAQVLSLSASVADLAGDDQCLLVELDGLAGVAEGGVGEAEIAQGVALAAAVADLMARSVAPRETRSTAEPLTPFWRRRLDSWMSSEVDRHPIAPLLFPDLETADASAYEPRMSHSPRRSSADSWRVAVGSPRTPLICCAINELPN